MISRDDVKKLAKLARIAVTESEVAHMQSEIAQIFTLIEEMQAVDTSGVTPMTHALELTQRLREDLVTESDQRGAFQAIAPAVEGGLYLVPKVIE
ncbi:MAG TPA: Asp-tRNA(Asn)/Glu-tRNA(Gln) amidotransferase subunit GatC [Burkholderiales bacterium]|nr:Asp-tRNA(Asn)/Glu-tRNA(Gln) amidotransferase subunit GatC [Burkholderiales bacterium]